ncbi:hypothetical protein V6Z11_A05G430200 [Gossypium hirsutum]
MALIQLAGISVLFLFKLVFDCIKRRNRPTVTSNPLATIRYIIPHGAVGTVAVIEGVGVK